MKKPNVTFKTLIPDHPLFAELSKKGEYKWWENMKKRLDLYIEVRKDNKINIYYQGASVVSLERSSENTPIRALTHSSYIGMPGSRYVNYVYSLDDSNINSILENIRKNPKFDGTAKEKWSEKYIQGNIITKNKRKYIDSEFAYIDDKFDIRVDLVECIAGELRFVELKRIDDNRMVSLDMRPEILSQMTNYREFIKQH